jgi:hypothetical protein
VNIEEARKLVGRRVLVNLYIGYTLTANIIIGNIIEWKVLEVSPSGKWTRVIGEAGDKCWRLTSEFNIIEALEGEGPQEKP